MFENCPYCHFECPLMAQGVEIIRRNEDAVIHASQLFAYEREVSRLKSALISYLGQTREAAKIGAGDYIINETSFYRGLVPSKIIQVCMDEGLDIDKILKVNSDSLKKIEDKELKDKLTAGGIPASIKTLKFEKKIVESVEEREGNE